jgi:hypothetical protein
MEDEMLKHTPYQRTKAANNEGEFVIALTEPVHEIFNITSEHPYTKVTTGQMI